jgi:hypothetical protein
MGEQSAPGTESLRQFIDAVIVPALIARYLREHAHAHPTDPSMVLTGPTRSA